MDQSKSISLTSIKSNLKDHDKVNTQSGKMKGPWNHFYTSNISPTSASYASEDNGYNNTKLSGFSWPPRLYVCSFCKREFRSAQALGGHMNVHRRDRARLRVQSPPTSPSSPQELVTCTISPPITTVSDHSTNPNPIPNPNPNPNPNLIYSSAWMIQKPYNISTSNYITHSSTTIPYPKPPTSPFIISSSSKASVSGTMRRSVTRPNPISTSTCTKTSNLIDVSNKEHHNNIPNVNINKGREKGEVLRLGLSGAGVLRNKEEVDLELRLGYSS